MGLSLALGFSSGLSPATMDNLSSGLSPATMDNLSEDVLSNIFVCLQAKQLAQMRCMCKSWNDLLSKPFFVKSHLDRSIHKNDGILLVFFDYFSFDSGPFTAHLSRSPYLELPNFIKLPANLQSETGFGELIGSVNGLICFKHRSYSNVIYIWNPALSALLTLPPYSMPSRSRDHSIGEALRFGFDSKADDYKVVNIIQDYKMLIQVEVYSMRKGSWKLITHNIPSRVTCVYTHVYIPGDGHAGHVHWLAGVSFGQRVDTILSFDLGTQAFCEIPLPDSVTNPIVDATVSHLRNRKDVGVLGGKLCVITSAQDYKCEVWVMDESWVKHHVLPTLIGDWYPMGFTLQNEYLFVVYPQGLGVYDPIAAKTNYFEYRLDYLVKGCKIVEYVDSRVWITPAK